MLGHAPDFPKNSKHSFKTMKRPGTAAFLISVLCFPAWQAREAIVAGFMSAPIAMTAWFLLEAGTVRAAEKPWEDVSGPTQGRTPPATPVVAKTILRADQAGENLLRGRAWTPYGEGFEYHETGFVCNNGAEAKTRRGIAQTVELNQARPDPIVAVCESKAEAVTGAADSDYSLYLDLKYADNTPLWGQVASFSAGTHGWQRRQVVVMPEKPVKQLSFYMLLRGHGGRAWFRNPVLCVIRTPAGGCLFDGLPVIPKGPAREGFQVRDVAAGSDFVRIEREALGLRLDVTSGPRSSREDKGLDVHVDGYHRQGPRRYAALRSPNQRPAAPLAGRSAAEHAGSAASRICECHAVPRRFQRPVIAVPAGRRSRRGPRYGDWH